MDKDEKPKKSDADAKPPEKVKKPKEKTEEPPAPEKGEKPPAPEKTGKPPAPEKSGKPPAPGERPPQVKDDKGKVQDGKGIVKPVVQGRPPPRKGVPDVIDAEDGFNYSAPPPQARALEKLKDEDLIEVILVERRRRVYWEKEAQKKKREVNFARHRSEKIAAYTKSLKDKLHELDIESEVLGVEEQVFAKGFEAQLADQEDDFCNKILELERHMDNNEITWHIQSSELRDEDVIAMNGHLQQEDELHLEIEELKRKISEENEKLKGLKQSYVKGDKIVQIQDMKLQSLKQRYRDHNPPTASRPLGGATIAASVSVTPKHKPSARASPYVPTAQTPPNQYSSPTDGARYTPHQRTPQQQLQRTPQQTPRGQGLPTPEPRSSQKKSAKDARLLKELHTQLLNSDEPGLPYHSKALPSPAPQPTLASPHTHTRGPYSPGPHQTASQQSPNPQRTTRFSDPMSFLWKKPK